jgi:hypothetical protein
MHEREITKTPLDRNEFKAPLGSECTMLRNNGAQKHDIKCTKDDQRINLCVFFNFSGLELFLLLTSDDS